MGKLRKTTEQFKEELFAVNPNVEVLGEYLGAKEKVLCRCKICGNEWLVTPTNLLSGKGCPECGKRLGGKKKSSKSAQEFEEKARKVHGDKYDYSKVDYKKAIEKVEIVCPIHGSFWQTPHSHLSGSGCPKCYNDSIVKNTEEFIAKASQIHGNKYDYSKVNYINTKTKVCIICHEKDENGIEHGEFWQTPNDHLSGSGCYKCGIIESRIKQKLTKEEFVNKANMIHNYKYDYSEADYINSKSKLCVICHEKDENGVEHGKFWMKPENHLGGRQGCPICGRIKANKAESLTTEEFIEKSKQVHGDTYDYSKANYINCRTKVEIICPKHGSFWQDPSSHMHGVGCPKCSKSKGERNLEILLNSKQIIYLDQYRFSNLSNIIVDFYIPSKNCVIEYNGMQHYVPIEHFGGEIKFKEQCKRDQKLREYCKNEEINLLEIPYTCDTIEKMENFIKEQNPNLLENF